MDEVKRENIEEMSDPIETYPRDFLRRFGGGSRPSERPAVTVKEEPMKEVELSLGLYLGRGSFSGDNKGLLRSSSLSTFSSFPKKEEEEVVFGKESSAMSSAHTLMRACSLPVETGDAQRKMKELQSLRRLEAKRKREERRSLRLKAEENGGAMAGTDATSSTLRRRRRQEPRMVAGCLMSQKSRGAQQGGSSTSSSDYDCRPMQGLNISRCGGNADTESPPPATQRSPLVRPASMVEHNPREKNHSSNREQDQSKESSSMSQSMMVDMPCVSAKGDGPDGRRIDGFLYKYTKGEEVRIMCVCHGSFLSPTEFVKHAGGGDVEFPLRHIVVYPSPQTFL